MQKVKTQARKQSILLYDFLFCRGGAERVVMEMSHAMQDTDICVGFRNRSAFPESEFPDSAFIELGAETRARGWRVLKTAYYFNTRTSFLKQYDRVIYSGTIAPLAVHNHPDGCNIYYCHSIPRYIYDLRQFYTETTPWWQRPALGMVRSRQRSSYQAAINRMDYIVANSGTVRDRIRQYLGLDASIVNPPCDVDAFRWDQQGDYYLSTARLEKYKRVDLIVAAFLQMPDRKLVVASGGSDLVRLKQMAAGADNIEFTGWISDTRMQQLVSRCIASLYIARDEDFGMSPVESMAAGKPVIGVAEGGLRETVNDGETGILLNREPDIDDVVSAVVQMTPRRALEMRFPCEARAQLFRKEIFMDSMRSIIEDCR